MEELQIKDVLKTYNSREAGKKSIDSHIDWFPVILSPKLAGIVGDLIGDGHVQGNPKWRIDFTSKDLGELARFNNQIKDIFNIQGKTRPCTTNQFGKTFNLGVNSKLLARILSISGVPTGAKVLKEFLIPNWIISNKENFRIFIRSLFSCEACVSIEGKNSFIDFSMWKSTDKISNGIEFFKQIKYYLKLYFGIETTNMWFSTLTNKRKDGVFTRGIRLRIKKLDSLIKFSEEIGFHLKEKENKLNTVINIKSMGQSLGQ